MPPYIRFFDPLTAECHKAKLRIRTVRKRPDLILAGYHICPKSSGFAYKLPNCIILSVNNLIFNWHSPLVLRGSRTRMCCLRFTHFLLVSFVSASFETGERKFAMSYVFNDKMIYQLAVILIIMSRRTETQKPNYRSTPTALRIYTDLEINYFCSMTRLVLEKVVLSINSSWLIRLLKIISNNGDHQDVNRLHLVFSNNDKLIKKSIKRFSQRISSIIVTFSISLLENLALKLIYKRRRKVDRRSAVQKKLVFWKLYRITIYKVKSVQYLRLTLSS
ncbi:hypothetical protein AGLY_017307 [Aphis glycines]|uniref:Uncharacterized protein n=1 Tax=Aphis glycines TaxID=307491 RepID=A0A6G0SV93_APHGL|nr:hypothetical protein AGLY_017307 [Aphis glycines]